MNARSHAPVLPAPADRDLPADVMLAVHGVGKAYRLYARPQDRLKQFLFGRFGQHYGHEFWALRDVSIEVRRGEMLGVVGRNGSGKSTLLQIMAGIHQPTTGTVTRRGRVGALLELGSGFDPEVTGRENVFVNGAILGVSAAEIDRRFDAIAAFADIGEFIDQPVKMYSSGMFLRLAFAVTTSLDPDVLLIDEALAVGDVFFRQKCYRRLAELREKGASIVLVSHAMADVEQFCARALLLDRGSPVAIGVASEIVKRYYLIQQQPMTTSGQGLGQPGVAVSAETPAEAALAVAGAPRDAEADANAGARAPEDDGVDLTAIVQVSDGNARCVGIAIRNERGQTCTAFEQGERAVFVYEFEVDEPIAVPIGGLVIRNEHQTLVHGKSTLELECDPPNAVPRHGRVRFAQSVQLALAPGEYTVEVGFASIHPDDFHNRARIGHEELTARVTRICHLVAPLSIRVGLRQAGTPTQLLHHGIADLPGACTIILYEHTHA